MPSQKLTPFRETDIPDLSGYVAIVTGGNSGIGYETSLQLALHGARVYVAGRSADRVKKAIAEMKTNTAGDLDIHYLAMDLQSLQSVKDGAEAFLQQEEAITSQAPRLDLLINNAGVSTPRLKPNPHKTKQKHLAIAVAVADAQSGMQILAVPFKLTADKFESQWQTNFLAPFFLVKCLLPVLESTAENSTSNTRVRIVNVASEAALLPGAGPKEIDYAHPNLDHVKGSMAVWKRYGHSKLASIIHARALSTRLASSNITAYAVHPGLVATNISASDPTLFGRVCFRLITWGIFPGTVSIKDAAMSTLFCAISEKAVRDSGSYFGPGGNVDKRPEKWTRDEKEVERLWGESERMLRESGF